MQGRPSEPAVTELHLRAVSRARLQTRLRAVHDTPGPRHAAGAALWHRRRTVRRRGQRCRRVKSRLHGLSAFTVAVLKSFLCLRNVLNCSVSDIANSGAVYEKILTGMSHSGEWSHNNVPAVVTRTLRSANAHSESMSSISLTDGFNKCISIVVLDPLEIQVFFVLSSRLKTFYFKLIKSAHCPWWQKNM